jgi:drug/metabolite transporter (DMT)-like permease
MIGLVFGDACGFKALVMIGPRLSTLIRTSTPIITTTIAWFFLDEKLHTYEAAGIAITVFGIAWVVAERKDSNTLHKSHRDSGSLTTGVLLSLGSSLGQAAGLVLAKHAMTQCGGAIDPYAAAFVRIVMATAVIWIYSIVKGEALSAVQTIRDDPKSFRLIVGGAVSSTFLGIWMSLVAVKYVDAGVAETLGSMTPIVILPLLWKLKGEHISLRAIIGSFVAVGGVAVMFLLP